MSDPITKEATLDNPTDLAEAIAMIRRSAEGIADRQDLSRIRKLRYTPLGFDRETWRTMCELGWPALRVAEERGGIGLGLAAYCALAQELGAALVPEPLIPAVLVAAFLDDETLAGQLAGSTLVLPAWQDQRDAVGPTKSLSVIDGRLYGSKQYVAMAAAADAFLAIDPGAAWLVAADQPGVTLTILGVQDGGHVGRVCFDGAVGRRLEIAAEPALAEACLATSAYMLGMIDAVLQRTVDYMNVRVQFGKLIGSFQALQHRVVDLKLQAELTRASVEEAAARWDAAPAVPASYAAISRAKVRANETVGLVTREAVQLHGAIGFTDEFDIGLFLRKAMVMAPQFGSTALHRHRFAQLA